MKTDKLWIRVLINIQIFLSFNYEAMVVILGKVILCSVTLTDENIDCKFLFGSLAYPEQHSGYSINILPVFMRHSRDMFRNEIHIRECSFYFTAVISVPVQRGH